MATLSELNDLISGNTDDQGLRAKVKAGAIIRAADVYSEASPSQARLDWASATLANPESSLDVLFNAVIGLNDDATIAQITSASDAAIETNIDTVVVKLYP